MDLNFTSTKPSPIDTSFFTHQGKVPWPDCINTFGLLGAVGSACTSHFGEPRPVTPAVQPVGTFPASSRSKLMVSACAMVMVAKVINVAMADRINKPPVDPSRRIRFPSAPLH